MTAAPVIEIPGLEDDDEYLSKTRSDLSDDSEDAAKDDSGDSHEEVSFEDVPQRYEDTIASDASTDEAVIFDAYARDSRSSSLSSESRTSSPEQSPPTRQLSLPPVLPPMPKSGSHGNDWFQEEANRTPTQETVIDPMIGVNRVTPSEAFNGARPMHPVLPPSLTIQVPTGPFQPSLSSPTTPQQRTSAISSPQYELPPGMAPPPPRSTIPPGIALQQQRGKELMSPVNVERPGLAHTESGASLTSSVKDKEKEKEKKGGFFSKKKEKEKKSKEKDGFLGSLFGGKKKQEEASSIANFSSAGPAAAAALLGSSKSARSLGFSPTLSPTFPGFSSFARYPIHVERAVYRLSHIKLANARRPLYEQVLISNLMFWYLGVIGRNVAEEKKPNATEEKKEEAKPVVKGTPPKATDSGVAGTPLVPAPKKSGLTKPDRSRGGRDNEAPVRTPSYGMQNAQVDSEVRNATMSMGTKNSTRPQTQQAPQQYSSQHLSSQHQSFSPVQQQSPQHIPGFTSQQRTSSTPPQPARSLSSPAPGPQPRPPPNEMYPSETQNISRDIQPLPRGLPQSSFGPPPSAGSQALQSQPMIDPRQRTLSNPPSGQPPPSASSNMRRIVTDGRSSYSTMDIRDRPSSSQSSLHAGPQPGQIFAYPGAGPQAGHHFPPRPPPGSGQIFTGGQPGHFHRPPPYPNSQFNGPRPSFDQGRPMPPQQWEAPLRLPPGAGPVDHQYLGPPDQPHRRGAPSPTDPYQRGPFSPPYLPQVGPPPLSPANSQSSGPSFYPSLGGMSPASTQPGQLFNPYPGRPMPVRQTSGDEMFRRAQAVPQGGPYGAHHR